MNIKYNKSDNNKVARVLISAYACEPKKGSEPEVGWQWVKQIAKFQKVHVITRLNNKKNIDNVINMEEIRNLNIEYIDLPNWAKFWKKGNRGVHLYYYIWQLLALKKGLELQKDNNFVIAHHITFVNDWIGPGISAIPTKFIWGPIGSHPYVPRKYWQFLGKREILNGLLRISARKTARFRDPLYRLALERSKKILAINKECKFRLPGRHRNKTILFPQNAINTNEIFINKKKLSRPLKILSVGRLVGFKGYRLALMAFSEHLKNNNDSILKVLGDGGQRRELEDLVKALNIDNNVIFDGNVPRKQVLKEMQNSDVFLFPSFEGAGMVVIEAMAKGLPVVCLDFGGPGEYVTEECGIKVPLTEPNEVIDGLAEGLNRLATNPDLYESVSAEAIRRVSENYLWDQVGEKINSIYKEVLGER